MVTQQQVAHSKAIQQRTGRTFHVATRLLPRRVRHATYVMYAFFRVADEVVDAAETAPPATQREELERLRAEALGEAPARDPVLEAFAELRVECGISAADVNVFIDEMETDITKSRYESYAELESYMDGSAAAVGRMMTAVMDPADPEAALPHATALGEAFQLTNFIRDVREDLLERERVYLPRTTLEDCGVTDAQLERLECTPEFRAAIRTELERTERKYREGVAGIEYLPRDCQFAVLLAAVLYAEHHRLVRARDCDVLSVTPSLTRRRLCLRSLETWWHWFRNPDPVAVFHRVSCVDPEEPAAAVEADQETGGRVTDVTAHGRRAWRSVERLLRSG